MGHFSCLRGEPRAPCGTPLPKPPASHQGHLGSSSVLPLGLCAQPARKPRGPHLPPLGSVALSGTWPTDAAFRNAWPRGHLVPRPRDPPPGSLQSLVPQLLQCPTYDEKRSHGRCDIDMTGTLTQARLSSPGHIFLPLGSVTPSVLGSTLSPEALPGPVDTAYWLTRQVLGAGCAPPSPPTLVALFPSPLSSPSPPVPPWALFWTSRCLLSPVSPALCVCPGWPSSNLLPRKPGTSTTATVQPPGPPLKRRRQAVPALPAELRLPGPVGELASSPDACLEKGAGPG